MCACVHDRVDRVFFDRVIDFVFLPAVSVVFISNSYALAEAGPEKILLNELYYLDSGVTAYVV